MRAEWMWKSQHDEKIFKVYIRATITRVVGRTRWGLWSGAGDVIVFYRLKAEARGSLVRTLLRKQSKGECKKIKKKSNKEKKVYKTRAGNTRRLEGGNTIKREGTNWISDGKQLIGRMKLVCSLRAGKNKTQKDFIVPPLFFTASSPCTNNVRRRKKREQRRTFGSGMLTNPDRVRDSEANYENVQRFERIENSHKTPE